jgi:predicted dehydrogenase
VDDLRIGILGAARIAPMALVRPARRTEGVVVAAVAARDPERARAFAKKQRIARVCATYEELVKDPGIDAIYNPLPNGLHGRWTLAALEAGKHVLCEKPFAANREEAEHVAEAAARSGLVVMEAFHYRYHPLARRMAEIVHSGELGRVKRVEARFSAPLAKRGDIRYRADLAGGALMDMGCYVVNLLRMLGGEPMVTSARAKLSSPGVDRAMEAELAFPSGASGWFRCSMFSSSLLRLSARVVAEKGEFSVFNPFAPHIWHRLTVAAPSGRRVEHFDRKPTYAYQLEAFRAAVSRGTPFVSTPEDAIKNMSVIDDVYRAAGLAARQPSA